MQGALKTARAAYGANGEYLRFVRLGAKATKDAQPAFREAGVGKTLVKFFGESRGQFGVSHPHQQVEPALRDAIALMAVADVCATGERNLPVADKQFAMITHAKAREAEGIELPYFPTNYPQRLKEISGQSE